MLSTVDNEFYSCYMWSLGRLQTRLPSVGQHADDKRFCQLLAACDQSSFHALQESWYEKLNRWDEALDAYERKYHDHPLGTPAHLDAALGRLRWGPLVSARQSLAVSHSVESRNTVQCCCTHNTWQHLVTLSRQRGENMTMQHP